MKDIVAYNLVGLAFVGIGTSLLYQTGYVSAGLTSVVGTAFVAMGLTAILSRVYYSATVGSAENANQSDTESQ